MVRGSRTLPDWNDTMLDIQLRKPIQFFSAIGKNE
jgi:hypothetical protein